MVFGTAYGNLCETFLCIAHNVPRRRKMGADLVARGLSLGFHRGKLIWECRGVEIVPAVINRLIDFTWMRLTWHMSVVERRLIAEWGKIWSVLTVGRYFKKLSVQGVITIEK
jgi:hypothetical protein